MQFTKKVGYGFFDWLSNVGGIVKSLMAIFSVIAGIINY
jgi:hypothetical protein